MKKKIFNITVTDDFHDYRIDKFLQLYFKKTSRTKLQSLIRSQNLKINNVLINEASKKLKLKMKLVLIFHLLKKP